MSGPSVPAGWYADPNDASQLRWWDGENWLDHFAPAALPAPVVVAPVGPAVNLAPPVLNDPPAAVPVVAAVALPTPPPAGPAETAAPTGSSDSRSSLTLLDHAANFVGDRRTQGGAMGVAGAALAAGGAASLIRKEGGGRKAAQIFLVGVVIAVLGVFGLVGGISVALNGPADVNVTGTVTKIKSNFFGNQCVPTVEFQAQGQTHTIRPDDFETCIWEVGDPTAVTYTAASGGTVAELGTASTTDLIPGSIALIFAGIIVSSWALVPLAIRAGSIVGGAYLIRQGFLRAKSRPDVVSAESAVT